MLLSQSYTSRTPTLFSPSELVIMKTLLNSFANQFFSPVFVSTHWQRQNVLNASIQRYCWSAATMFLCLLFTINSVASYTVLYIEKESRNCSLCSADLQSVNFFLCWQDLMTQKQSKLVYTKISLQFAWSVFLHDWKKGVVFFDTSNTLPYW